jgi:hypothetical protein
VKQFLPQIPQIEKAADLRRKRSALISVKQFLSQIFAD